MSQIHKFKAIKEKNQVVGSHQLVRTILPKLAKRLPLLLRISKNFIKSILISSIHLKTKKIKVFKIIIQYNAMLIAIISALLPCLFFL